jgi:hypothetical protein
MAVLLGGIALSPELLSAMASRAAAGETANWLLPDDQALLAELAETIIPTTDTPGAKAAGVDRFIALMVQDCLKPADQEMFRQGLRSADTDCLVRNGKTFVACTGAQRIEFLKKLEADSKNQPDPNFWRVLKSLTLQGYFTSEIGMTQALAYDPIPGVWIPDLKIDDNTKAWASMF